MQQNVALKYFARPWAHAQFFPSSSFSIAYSIIYRYLYNIKLGQNLTKKYPKFSPPTNVNVYRRRKELTLLVTYLCIGGAHIRPGRQYRAHHDEPLRSDAVGSDRALRPDRGRQPGDIVQAEPLEPGTEHHDHERLLAAIAVRGVVHTAVSQVGRSAPAAATARTGHGVVGLPRFGHHHDHVHQTGERPRGMARTVRHRFADVPADGQRHIHQPDHIATIRQRKCTYTRSIGERVMISDAQSVDSVQWRNYE